MNRHIQAEAHDKMNSKDGTLNSTTLLAAQQSRAEELFLEYASSWTVLVDVETIWE
jgi:hypothetical protein